MGSMFQFSGCAPEGKTAEGVEKAFNFTVMYAEQYIFSVNYFYLGVPLKLLDLKA